ncbi:metallophosphoesterase [uncultured Methanobacterium sp.]|uniref:metallophosphoesterase n=1 Tax=uncultured Methanobacterium sp. TaxID=176306 RepID=UPI002AA5F373|nr:metallophosphoesterase [uncultured Methanobacterium sp.]
MKRILNLPASGILLVITDLHGNGEDFKKYENIWKNHLEDGNQIILTGDLIHCSNSSKDRSVEILKAVQDYSEYENFHLLLGNHEWCHIVDAPVYKGESNQKKDFEELLKLKFGYRWVEKLEEYVEFFKTLPFAAKTGNGVLISHSGPPIDSVYLGDLENITEQCYHHNDMLDGLLWKRDYEFNQEDLEFFLKRNNCKYHIIGHTPVDGYQVNYGKQLVISSSFGCVRKAYLELDLEKNLENMDELVKMVQFLDE